MSNEVIITMRWDGRMQAYRPEANGQPLADIIRTSYEFSKNGTHLFIEIWGGRTQFIGGPLERKQ